MLSGPRKITFKRGRKREREKDRDKKSEHERLGVKKRN